MAPRKPLSVSDKRLLVTLITSCILLGMLMFIIGMIEAFTTSSIGWGIGGLAAAIIGYWLFIHGPRIIRYPICTIAAITCIAIGIATYNYAIQPGAIAAPIVFVGVVGCILSVELLLFSIDRDQSSTEAPPDSG